MIFAKQIIALANWKMHWFNGILELFINKLKRLFYCEAYEYISLNLYMKYLFDCPSKHIFISSNSFRIRYYFIWIYEISFI